MEKVAENGRKVKAKPYFFAVFSPFMKNGKKSLKMDEKLRL
jgi:hypothetical protein